MLTLFVMLVTLPLNPLASPPMEAQPSIELLTIEPGTVLWARFGHTALRVREGAQDVVFSFGAAPFLDPHFMWSFARGEGEFSAIAQSFESVLATYRAEDRTLQSQELVLPIERKQKLAKQLYEAIKPPNNRYRYDQLYDNCATRVRDLIDRASDGALTRAARLRQPGLRYRDYTLRAMAGHPVGHWALDLLGGPHQDRPVDGYHEMFLPVHLRDRVAEAHTAFEGVDRALAKPLQTLLTRRGPPLSKDLGRARRIMLSMAATLTTLVAVGLALGTRRRLPRRLGASASVMLALWSGLFGSLVVPLALLSHVHNFSPNENAWLFLPLDALCVWPLWRSFAGGREPARIWKLYLGARLLTLALVVLLKLGGILTQDNWVFVAVSAAFLLSAASAVVAFPRLGRAL